ncbi:hypothetical protein [Streptomyces sp. NPDC058374]|uniref:hypothetical protein n=1 Tax=Streptomyces sp. NPDC058374 TaxID=3346466 RepID=UPI003650AD04
MRRRSCCPGATAASRTLDTAHRARLTEITDELLPPFWGELIRRTGPDSVFLQRLYDVTAPRYDSERLLLLGDAATVARPHTGAGAVKALQEVAVLESSLAGAADWASAAAAYEVAVGHFDGVGQRGPAEPLRVGGLPPDPPAVLGPVDGDSPGPLLVQRQGSSPLIGSCRIPSDGTPGVRSTLSVPPGTLDGGRAQGRAGREVRSW